MPYSRRNEQWVLDAFLRTVGNDILFPGVDAFRIERGYKLADLKSAYEKTKSYRVSSRLWEDTARHQLTLAEESLSAGHTVTGRDSLFRAALYLSRAQWSIFADSDHKRALLLEIRDLMERIATLTDEYTIERVVIPFGEHHLTGLLHLPSNVREAVPAVLFTPGMDMTKEEFPDITNNIFIKRGMAVLSIDGPGQGESHLDGLKVTADNYQRAGAAWFDNLVGRKEIDFSRIGVFGVSMGSYWAPSIAAREPRFAACVGALGCFLQKDTIFAQAQPTFRRRFLYMSGLEDSEEEFETLAAAMTLKHEASDIRCPSLFATGELDELCPVEDAEEMFSAVPSPKELWIYDGEFHPLGGASLQMLYQE